MKKRLFFIVFLLFICLPYVSFADESWDFKAGLDGWTTQQTKGRLPILASPNIYFDADEVNTIEIRMKSTGTVYLLWIGTFDNQFNQQKSLPITIKNDKFNTYTINIKSRNPLWSGSISKILISPTGKLELDYIKLREASLVTNFHSGLSEFFGPTGRTIIGSTINNIKSSKFLGHPITFYMYWILLGVAIALTLLSLSQREREAPKKIVWIIIIFWLLLEINAWYNQINILKTDWPLVGKSLDEKRAEITGVDFYSFLEFCNKKLPPRSKIKILSPSGYLDSKGAYYLYPHRQKEQAEYLLIYHKDPGDENKNCKSFAKYKEGEYILKCN